MRIFFITTNDRIFLPFFFDKVFSNIDYEIVGVAAADDPNFKKFLINSFSFMGFRLFACEVINQVKVRLLDIARKIFTPNRKHSIQSVCGKYSIPFSNITRVNTKSFRSFLKNQQIDVLVSVACPQILRKRILNIPSKAAINIHYALLPHYRGQYPSFWVLAHGEEYTGVSVHYMVEKVDAGDILIQLKEKITPDDTFYSLVKRLKTTIGPKALIMALDKINKNDSSTIKNNPDNGSYFSFPTKTDMAEFKKRGRKWR
ncbi:MAG: hypothetical protein J7K40_13290 [candidate division Zixibacteria bacterium]|nr:hypothetical protein [candidate division Zixibacteria bacterium]